MKIYINNGPYPFFTVILILIFAFAITGCFPARHHGRHHGSSRGSLSHGIDTGTTRSNHARHSRHSNDFSHSRSGKPFYAPETQLYIATESVSVANDVLAYDSNNSDDYPEDDIASDSALVDERQETHEAFQKLSGDDKAGVSVSLSRSLEISKQFESLYRNTWQFDPRSDHSNLSIKLSYTNFDFNDDWQYAANLKNPWSLDFGIDYKVYLTEDSQFIQPYIGCGFAYGYLYWSYNENIIDESTGDEITGDSLEYLRLAAIVGLDIRVSRVVRLGIDLQQDYTFHSVTTSEGFIDDIFDDYGTTTLGARLTLIF